MLQEVRFRCGHMQTMDLTGQAEERAKKADWYAKHVTCPDCRINMAPQEGGRQSVWQEYILPVGLFSVHLPE